MAQICLGSHTGVTKMEKNPEMAVSGASIMKNVWEIRVRDYNLKLNMEKNRLGNSAMEKINQDWAKRMSGKINPRKMGRKAEPPKESAAQMYKDQQLPLGRPSRFVSSRQQKIDGVKRNNLALLLSLNENQPGMLIWEKAWKISQSLPEPRQISTSPTSTSDWGHSWKFLNLQPCNEAKLWVQQDTNNNTDNNLNLYLWNKADKALHSQLFEQDIPYLSGWKEAWKYAKQRKESSGERNASKHASNNNLDKLQEFSYHNEEESSFDSWNNSWMSVKLLKEEYSKCMCDTKENMNGSDTLWGESWKHFKQELHSKSKSASVSLRSGWGDSWRLLNANSQKQQEKISSLSEPQENTTNIPLPLGPRISQPIVNVSREEKYTMLWSSQFQAENVLPTVWQQSWIMIKEKYMEQPIQNLKKDLKEDLKEESLLQMEGKQELTRCKDLQVKHVEIDVKPMHKPAKMLEHKDKEAFMSSWKDAWKSMKCQLKHDRARGRRQNMPLPEHTVTAHPSVNEWGNSWRSTTLNVNLNTDLWQQGWSSYTQIRPIRRVQENGPPGPCGWSESWRSTRPHSCVVERGITQNTCPFIQPLETQVYTAMRSLEDWEESWRFSTNQFHHDRPSMTEWEDSWRFCNFQHENWVRHKPNQYVLKLQVFKAIHCASHNLSRSCGPSTLKEAFPLEEWNKSWKIQTSTRKEVHNSEVIHLVNKELLQAWDKSWMCSVIQLFQSEPSNSSYSMADLVQYESSCKWGRSWKIYNPQPPQSVASWFQAKPSPFHAHHMVLWIRNKSNRYLLANFSKDYAKVHEWGKSWRFTKLDIKTGDSKCKREKETVIMAKTKRDNRYLFSEIDKSVPQVKRWTDACKIAKSQPHPKWNARHKVSQGKGDGDAVKFAEWAESWKFTNDSLNDVEVKMSVSLNEWEESWKYILTPYPLMSEPKKSKGRS